MKPPPWTRAQVFGLCAMSLAVFAIANDFTAPTVSLPSIEKHFGADVTTGQWVINGYTLIFAVLIVTGGRLADLFGRRRVFFVGATLFAGFSLAVGLSPDIGVLLAGRGLMGIGGSLVWPAILGMTFVLTPGRSGFAGALVLGVAGIGATVGPMLGGALTDSVGWRWIFFLNLPIMSLAALVTWRSIPAEGPSHRERIDYGGVATLSIGLLALMIGLD
ncbi:MAG: MFS transporter, partial [Acidobacteriota bacterium]|nr:MFS transporter [Acidobacteriota bacterium]